MLHCTALQAIKNAEADERIADQLAALQLTLSKLADQEDSSNPEDMADSGDGTKANITSQVLCGLSLVTWLREASYLRRKCCASRMAHMPSIEFHLSARHFLLSID